MKRHILTLLLCGLALPAAAQQTSLLTASPIPDGAETRFCYYAGMAYSRNAYILVGEGRSVTQFVGGSSQANISGQEGTASEGALHTGGEAMSRTEQKLMECVPGDDGVLGWSALATMQLSK